ncbi:MAG: lysine--tRNA ligase [Candidatus Shikimatogenerans bostrichidophilus]|nr:MAG: lysine--tRNA ligase [Candidatus Shikimatogenerans bostrichidophilus]
MYEQEKIRKKKLIKIKLLGINPYPSKIYKTNYNIKKILINKKKIIKNNINLSINGRILSIRNMSKSSFIDIKDYTDNKIQLFYNIKNINKKLINKEYYILLFKKYLDIGDIIWINGKLFLTKVKEYTILINKIKLLSKCIYPIPNIKIKKNKIYKKFKNKEKRYRMRYIDLLLNKKVKKNFLIRSLIIKYLRNFLNKLNLIEVDTPILQNIPGGANAKPFITYHNKFKKYLYLRISNELYLKRLIVGGFKGVYEFSRNFRNESIDKNHNPEFTILEFYISYKNYIWMMKLIEKLLKYICKKTFNKYKIKINNNIIDFSKKIKKIKLFNIIKKYTNLNINENTSLKELIKKSKKLKINIKENENTKEKIIDNIFNKYCKKKIKKPLFIIDYPKYMSPLAKSKIKNKKLTERFELYINGKEIANAYTELNDPYDQFKRFKKQNKKFIDKDFIKSLKIGMPPTVGIGIGIDRLIALFTNNNNIQEIILFPQMK